MPSCKRRQPGRYKPKIYIEGTCPFSLFQAENGLWGVKDAEGHIELEPKYHQVSQSAEELARDSVRLIHHLGYEVVSVSSEGCDLLCYFCSD